MQTVPMSLDLLLLKRTPGAELFLGGGAAVVAFTEEISSGSVTGTKPGLDFRTGVRIPTNLVQPSIHPGKISSIRRVDVELMFGRRQHQPFGIGTGLDFSAWRLGVGLIGRL